MKARELVPISQLYLEKARIIGYKVARRKAFFIRHHLDPLRTD